MKNLPLKRSSFTQQWILHQWFSCCLFLFQLGKRQTQQSVGSGNRPKEPRFRVKKGNYRCVSLTEKCRPYFVDSCKSYSFKSDDGELCMPANATWVGCQVCQITSKSHHILLLTHYTFQKGVNLSLSSLATMARCGLESPHSQSGIHIPLLRKLLNLDPDSPSVCQRGQPSL